MTPIIVDYNQHEAADLLADWVGDCIIVDNGSAIPNPRATVRLDGNLETVGGILAGLAEARKRRARYYWLLSTSMTPLPCSDPAGEMEKCFTSGVVGVSPQWFGDIQSPAHRPMMTAGPARILNTFSAWRADFLDSIGWFDPQLSTGWGTDFETSYLAHERGKSLIVTDAVQVEIRETKHGGRADFARAQMNEVLGRKYGPDWRKVLNAY